MTVATTVTCDNPECAWREPWPVSVNRDLSTVSGKRWVSTEIMPAPDGRRSKLDFCSWTCLTAYVRNV